MPATEWVSNEPSRRDRRDQEREAKREAKRDMRRRMDDEDEGKKGGVRWSAIILMFVMFGPALFPALAWVWGLVGTTDFGLAVSNGIYTVSSSIGLIQTYQDEVESFYREHNP